MDHWISLVVWGERGADQLEDTYFQTPFISSTFSRNLDIGILGRGADAGRSFTQLADAIRRLVEAGARVRDLGHFQMRFLPTN